MYIVHNSHFKLAPPHSTVHSTSALWLHCYNLPNQTKQTVTQQCHTDLKQNVWQADQQCAEEYVCGRGEARHEVTLVVDFIHPELLHTDHLHIHHPDYQDLGSLHELLQPCHQLTILLLLCPQVLLVQHLQTVQGVSRRGPAYWGIQDQGNLVVQQGLQVHLIPCHHTHHEPGEAWPCILPSSTSFSRSLKN